MFSNIPGQSIVICGRKSKTKVGDEKEVLNSAREKHLIEAINALEKQAKKNKNI